MKLFQYDKKVWENGETSHTWQFGIVKNTSLLWVRYETPGGIVHSAGGINILFSFFQSDSLFGAELNNDKQCFAFYFFTEYFSGWFEDT